MVPLGSDTGQRDLDLKPSYNQNFDSSPITRQEILVMFILQDFIEFYRGGKISVHGDFL